MAHVKFKPVGFLMAFLGDAADLRAESDEDVGGMKAASRSVRGSARRPAKIETRKADEPSSMTAPCFSKKARVVGCWNKGEDSETKNLGTTGIHALRRRTRVLLACAAVADAVDVDAVEASLTSDLAVVVVVLVSSSSSSCSCFFLRSSSSCCAFSILCRAAAAVAATGAAVSTYREI